MSPRPSASPFLVALPVRLFAALAATAFFQPDEYWQSLEVAHRWVWGYGHLTWEWRAAPGRAGVRELLETGGRGGIRSPLSVVPTAAVYGVLKALGWEESWILILAPRLLQAVFAATTDAAVHRLAKRVLGPQYAGAALLASLTSFFHFFTLSRTFSNSTETALTACALAVWPWSAFTPSVAEGDDEANKGHGPTTAREGEEGESLAMALVLAATATIMRPSNAVIWVALGGQLFWRSSGQKRVEIFKTAALVTLSAAPFSLLLDTAFYHTPTFTPLRFLHANVLRSVSLFYGANPFHFYLTQGIPLLLLTQGPFFLDGVRRLLINSSRRSAPSVALGLRNPEAAKALLATAAATTAAYSLLSHKEWRFLHPILPILHLSVAVSLVSRGSSSPSAPAPPSSAASAPSPTRRVRLKRAHVALLALSLVPALYLTALHGLAQNRVLFHLSSSLLHPRSTVGAKEEQRPTSVGFLMPCHSTGWQAFLHAPQLEAQPAWGDGEGGERMWQLTCEPPLSPPAPSPSEPPYLDQSDHFYLSPCTYLSSRFPPAVDARWPASPPLPAVPPSSAGEWDRGWHHAWPERVVLFSNLLDVRCPAPATGEKGGEETVGALLAAKGYSEEKRLWNTLGGWHEDERRRGSVVVLRWGGEEDGEGDGGGKETV
ncbi:hypothetical protein JCM10207_001526 [Rhodosporidiobolus poonsookiae]